MEQGVIISEGTLERLTKVYASIRSDLQVAVGEQGVSSPFPGFSMSLAAVGGRARQGSTADSCF